MLQSGLGGDPMMPGPDPNAGVGAPPAPDVGGMLGSLFGGEPAAPPEAINRTSVPTGPGSFSGVTTGG